MRVFEEKIYIAGQDDPVLCEVYTMRARLYVPEVISDPDDKSSLLESIWTIGDIVARYTSHTSQEVAEAIFRVVGYLCR